MTPAEQALRDAALDYHRAPHKGKISVNPTKPLSNQRDLSLAYSPGVAYPCLAIESTGTKTKQRPQHPEVPKPVRNKKAGSESFRPRRAGPRVRRAGTRRAGRKPGQWR